MNQLYDRMNFSYYGSYLCIQKLTGMDHDKEIISVCERHKNLCKKNKFVITKHIHIYRFGFSHIP